MLRKAMFLLAVLILLFVRTTPIPFSGIESRVFADSCPSGNPAPIQGSLTANTHHTCCFVRYVHAHSDNRFSRQLQLGRNRPIECPVD
jgi:hypothetical protein